MSTFLLLQSTYSAYIYLSLSEELIASAVFDNAVNSNSKKMNITLKKQVSNERPKRIQSTIAEKE